MENVGMANAIHKEAEKETVKEILDSNDKALQCIKELLYTYSTAVDTICGLSLEDEAEKGTDIQKSPNCLIEVVKYQRGSLRNIERTLERLNTRLTQTLG